MKQLIQTSLNPIFVILKTRSVNFTNPILWFSENFAKTPFCTQKNIDFIYLETAKQVHRLILNFSQVSNMHTNLLEELMKSLKAPRRDLLPVLVKSVFSAPVPAYWLDKLSAFPIQAPLKISTKFSWSVILSLWPRSLKALNWSCKVSRQSRDSTTLVRSRQSMQFTLKTPLCSKTPSYLQAKCIPEACDASKLRWRSKRYFALKLI